MVFPGSSGIVRPVTSSTSLSSHARFLIDTALRWNPLNNISYFVVEAEIYFIFSTMRSKIWKTQKQTEDKS